VAQKFLELKNGYSDYYIRESLSLEQFNKKRLYEMFSSYKSRKINVWTVYDDELKGLLGMDAGAWGKRHKEFYEKIILVCLNAINEKTSLTVTHERDKDKKGYFTTFTISEKNKTAKAIGQTKWEYKDLDEKSQRCYDEVTKLGVSPKLIMRIVTDYQAETWKWLGDNKENLKNNFFRNPPGVLLVYLGLAEGKHTNPRNIKVKKETPAAKPAPVEPQPATQKPTGVNKGIDLRKTVTFTNETDMIEAYDVIRLLTKDDVDQIKDDALQGFWKAANPDVTKIVSVNNKEWFACREYKKL
jgi:hypothetical protein